VNLVPFGLVTSRPLASELQSLADEQRVLWADPRALHDALEAIVAAWERKSSDLGERVARVDAAVAAALNALGLPRGPIAGIEIEDVQQFWTGSKRPDCRLLLSGPALRHIVRVERNGTDLLRTWTHESIHGRQAYGPAAVGEARLYEGYEEGMVEGLARHVVRDTMGLQPLERSYAYYVAAYEALAELAGIGPEMIWRALWRFPSGAVREHFADVVSTVHREVTGVVLTARQRGRLVAVADRLFSNERRDTLPEKNAMLATWKIALT
jgi:hypothetical protein